MKRATILLLLAWPVMAHDLWLVPQRQGGKVVIRAQTGEHFPDSEVALTADRVASFGVVTGDRKHVSLQGTAKGNSFVAQTEVTEGIAEIVVRPRILTMKPKQFEDYLRAEGLEKILLRRKKSRLARKPNPELYSKYAKALLGPTKDFALGHTFEIVALNRSVAGEEIRVRLLFRGRPLAGQRVAAGTTGTEGHHYAASGITGLDGVARMRLDRPGLWFIRSVHMIQAAKDSEAVWESFFATLTLEVGEGPPVGDLSLPGFLILLLPKVDPHSE